MGDISIRFDRLKLDGGGVADAQQFLEDLRDNMPRLNNRNNFMCCQGSENSPADALYICAEVCEADLTVSLVWCNHSQSLCLLDIS